MSSERAETSERGGGAPRVGVGVMLIDDEQRVLLTLRRRAPEAGCWSIFRGKLDFLEKLSECAVREAREEAGVEVELARLLCVTDRLLPQEGQHWIAPAYRWTRGERRGAKSRAGENRTRAMV
jgi:8-oxo-dGTP diphosphatase